MEVGLWELWNLVRPFLSPDHARARVTPNHPSRPLSENEAQTSIALKGVGK